MAQLPASVESHLRARLIDNARPLVFVCDLQAGEHRFRLLAGAPAYYGHKVSELAQLYAFIDALRVGRESSSTSYWPLVELPGGHPANVHWFSDAMHEYVIFTDADLCDAELRGVLPASSVSPWILAQLAADVESVIQGQAEQKGLDFTVEVIDPARRPLTLDRIRLQRVLCNLVSNSVRYTRIGIGSVRVRMQLQEAALQLEVHDTGAGIDPSYHDSIFEPFNDGAQRSRLGAGLGLSIVKALVQEMGGAIELLSEPGAGTSVSVLIPIPATAVGVCTGCAASVLPGSHSARVLVIDDDPTVTELLGLIIESVGLEVHTSNDPSCAVALMQQWDPGLILVDKRMGAWDGVSLIRQFKDAGFVGYLVMVSGDNGEEVRSAAADAGADLCLSKPLDVAALKRLLRRFLRTDGREPQSGHGQA